MAVTDFDYIATRNEIIAAAYRIAGVIEKSQPLNAAQIAQGLEALELLVKSWSNKDLFLWSYNTDDFSTVASQETYVSADGLDASIIGIHKAWVIDSGSSREEPLEVISWSRYRDIEDKETATGRPTHIAFKSVPISTPSATPQPSLYIYPSPDAVYTVRILGTYPLQDFDENADGTGGMRVELQRALKYGLAEDLLDEYPGPMNEREYIQRKAATLFAEAKSGNEVFETTSEVESLFGSGKC